MSDITWHQALVNKQERAARAKQKPCLLWFTGLSGAGKSTVANALERLLFDNGHHTYLLDGDNVRHGLCGDLGFSDDARHENIRRIGELGKLMVDAGLITLSAFISPFRADRQLVRDLMPVGEFIEVHVATDLATCESRDPKGLYKRARAGEIKHFTGIDSAYEVPEQPEITVHAGRFDPQQCAEQIIDYLRKQQVI